MYNRFVPIPRFPGYRINNIGKVWSDKRRIFRKTHKDKNGYQVVVLCRDGITYNRFVHRLILESFREIHDDLQCRHKNGIRDDNRLENLEWGTASENQLDAVKHGTQAGFQRKGEEAFHAKLTSKAVKEVKYLLKYSTLYQREIAILYGVEQTQISCIKLGKTWKHVCTSFCDIEQNTNDDLF